MGQGSSGLGTALCQQSDPADEWPCTRHTVATGTLRQSSQDNGCCFTSTL